MSSAAATGRPTACCPIWRARCGREPTWSFARRSATRPWQHVLDALSGYLLLASRLLAGDRACAAAWNFGPDDAGNRSVEEVLRMMRRDWPAVRWSLADAGEQPHEAALLHLDSGKARRALGWRPRWTLERRPGDDGGVVSRLARGKRRG